MDNHQPSSSTKIERKIVEKNRRNNMKILYSKLNSLIPNFNPKEALPLPDQIYEAVNYIKSLETKVKMDKEKKERLLMGAKRSRSSTNSDAKGNLDSPKIEVHELGSNLQVILTCGVENQFIFTEIIRILQEENIEVITANSSLAADTIMHHLLHAEIPQSSFQFGGSRSVSERLKSFVKGSGSDVEIEPAADHQFWDFEIRTDEALGLLDPSNI